MCQEIAERYSVFPAYQPANWERCPFSCSNSDTGFTAQETQFFIQSAFSVRAVADGAAQLKGEN